MFRLIQTSSRECIKTKRRKYEISSQFTVSDISIPHNIAYSIHIAFVLCFSLTNLLTLLHVLYELVVAQLVESLRHKPEGSGFDSRWCH